MLRGITIRFAMLMLGFDIGLGLNFVWVGFQSRIADWIADFDRLERD
jgi:hypothetical protein